MKYIAALVLASIAVGTFPSDMRTLSTSVGLLLAGISITLLIVAYRLVRSKRSTATLTNQLTANVSNPGDKADQSEAEETYWAVALAEFEGPCRRPGLWARAFSETGGNEPSAKALYLRHRVSELSSQTSRTQRDVEQTDEAVTEIASSTSAERARAMDELINRMSKPLSE